MDCAMRSAIAVASSVVGASTITRTTGSVPDGARPPGPVRRVHAATVATVVVPLGVVSVGDRPSDRHVAGHLRQLHHLRGDRRRRTAAPSHEIGEEQSDERAVAGGRPLGAR